MQEKERIVEDGKKVWTTTQYMTLDNVTQEWEEEQGDNCDSDNEHEELNNGASEDEQSEESQEDEESEENEEETESEDGEYQDDEESE